MHYGTTRTREQVEVAGACWLAGCGGTAAHYFGRRWIPDVRGRGRYEGCVGVIDRARARVIGHRIRVANKVRPLLRSRRWWMQRCLYTIMEAVRYRWNSTFCLQTALSDNTSPAAQQVLRTNSVSCLSAFNIQYRFLCVAQNHHHHHHNENLQGAPYTRAQRRRTIQCQ